MIYIASAGIISSAIPRSVVHQEREASEIVMDAIPRIGTIKKIELDANPEKMVRRMLATKSVSATPRPVCREIRLVGPCVWVISSPILAIHPHLRIKIGLNCSSGNLLGCMHPIVIPIYRTN